VDGSDQAGGRPRALVRGIHLILFVRDQEASARFYSRVLGIDPTLHVPGMTEFALSDGTVLGLMPEAGVMRLHGDALDLPASTRATRAELYLIVEDAAACHARAVAAGAEELSGLQERDWGDRVAYSLDLDNHMLAFAEQP
jgi:uncharacterized protein